MCVSLSTAILLLCIYLTHTYVYIQEDITYKDIHCRGTCLAQLVEHVTLHLRVMSSSPMLGI